MRISYSNVRGKKTNTSYPFIAEIKTADDLKKVAAFDHVCAIYKDGYNQRKKLIKGYRSNKTFQESDCLPLDCDNVSSDPLASDIPPAEWKTPKDVQAAYPDVRFFVVYSRNNMKEKDGKAARPKFHIYFPLKTSISDAKLYNRLKKKVRARFPAFDDGALDAARFFFGVENPQVEYFNDTFCIDEFMSRANAKITEGARNTTMSHFAGLVLKKYGTDDNKAHEAYLEEAKKCTPPLSEEELASIWNSAVGFYNSTIKVDKNYISPAEYNSMEFEESLIPSDFTDVGQAKAFLEAATDKVIYVKGLGLYYFTGKVWKDDDLLVQKALQGFTHKQLCLAWKMMNEAESEEAQEKAEAFYKFVLSRRKSSNIKATITELKPMVQVDVKMLDKDGFLLNTPDGTVDLRSGKLLAHDPKDYCTKICSVSPNDKGMDEWFRFLRDFTCKDKALEDYLQLESGVECIGEVLNENLVIQYGEGGNGKSTFNNAKFYVLGDYAGTISAELLTVKPTKNKGAELAETHNKRLILAAELPEGKRLDSGSLKNLSSTDPIHAEKKFEAPFNFIPTHTTVLYTNHLPKVGTIDKGTWDRLIVIPLKANFRGAKGEIKNYAKVLSEQCGGAILSWMIAGAKKYIDADYKLVPPKCVKDAMNAYREENDWISHFLSDCCEEEKTATQKAGELYEKYREHCDEIGEYKRSSADFKRVLIAQGFTWQKTAEGNIWIGLHLKQNGVLNGGRF